MQWLIGLLGIKGAGKDTAAKLFVEKFGFQRIAFADKLYVEVAEAFGITTEFLGNRDTKETPLPELALSRCRDQDFITVLRELSDAKDEVLDLTAPRSPRWIMQYWGTEYRRRSRFGYDAYWLDRVMEVLDANPTVNFAITDVRYKNEARLVTARSAKRLGRLVRVRRPELEAKEALDREAKGTAAHASETEMIGYPVDYEALNVEGQPGALLEALDDWYHTALAA